MKKKRTSRAGRMASKGLPNPIDVHVGARIRSRRTILGISQTALGEQIGLTFQQVQKYEKGSNRVSSSRLFDLARVLDVPLSYFFDEMDRGVSKQSPGQLLGAHPDPAFSVEDPMHRRETLELVRAYYGIADAAARARLRELVKALAHGGPFDRDHPINKKNPAS
jgi:transcriptional regulator with XRE-family HTH domain